jgi:hypothetical protein
LHYGLFGFWVLASAQLPGKLTRLLSDINAAES